MNFSKTKQFLGLVILSLITLNCQASTEHEEVSLKALPNICLDQDFRALTSKSATANHANDTSFEDQLIASDTRPFKTQKKASKKRSLKGKLKQYVYAFFADHLALDVKRYTHIRANDYLRFEFEPNFSSKGHLDSVQLTAILFE